MRVSDGDQKIWVNIKNIVAVTVQDGRTTIFTCVRGQKINVDQDYDMVVAYLDSKINTQTTEDLNV